LTGSVPVKGKIFFLLHTVQRRFGAYTGVLSLRGLKRPVHTAKGEIGEAYLDSDVTMVWYLIKDRDFTLSLKLQTFKAEGELSGEHVL
jgi:hypothetical protein